MSAQIAIEGFIAALLLLGSFFTLVGSIGIVRFERFYQRLHGPTKATTLGVGGFLLASLLFFAFAENGVRFHKLLITAFLFLTAPVSAHLLAKAAIRSGVPRLPPDESPPVDASGESPAPSTPNPEPIER